MNAIRYAVLLLVLVCGAVQAYTSPFDVTWEDAPIRVGAGQTIGTDVVIRVPGGHYLYKDKTLLTFTALEGVRVKQISYPSGVSQTDPLTGKPKQVYPEGEVAISVILGLPKDLPEGERELSAMLEFQGCSEKLCLRPEERRIAWRLDVSPAEAEVTEAVPEKITEGRWSIKDLLGMRDFKDVVAHGRHIALLIALVAGILTSFTPCVWPLIPVTLLVIGVHKRGHILSNLMLSLSLVAGIAVTYALISLVAVAIGARVGFLFQSRIFLGFVILFLVAMSLSMLGAFNIQLPIRLQNMLVRLGGKGYLGAFLSGISLGFMATPCAGPVVGAMFVWVASVKEYVFGAELLAVYAFGLGIFYIVIGTFYGTFAARVRNVKIGIVVKKLLGAALLLPALYYLSTFMPANNGSNGINWMSSEQDAVVEAVSSGRPMMVIVGAKWCPPCVKLEKAVLTDPEIKALAKRFVVLHIDATVETEEVKRLLDKYDVAGWPSIIFVSPNGRIYEGLSIVGEAPTVRDFARAMTEALAR